MAVQVELSQDLVEGILVWLPSQSLLRFKCISKQWNLLFSNQGFIQRHMKTRSSLHPHQVLFRRNSDCTLSIGTPHNNDEDGILFQPVKTKPQDLHIKYNVVGHCNGLMCIVDHSSETAGRSFVVWNPSTKEQQRIPVPGKLPWWKGRREYYGFGYDSIMDDYKIVLVSTSFDKRVEIQSLGLKKDSWEFAQNNAHDWLQRYLLEDSLCMMQSVDYVDFNAWIMKENQVTKTKSWIKIFSVSTKHSVFTPLPVLERLRVIVPICFTGNGRVVIIASKRQYFVLYDPKDESFKKAAPCGCGSTGSPICCFPLTPFVESLVSPGRKDASPGRQEHGVKRQRK